MTEFVTSEIPARCSALQITQEGALSNATSTRVAHDRRSEYPMETGAPTWGRPRRTGSAPMPCSRSSGLAPLPNSNRGGIGEHVRD